MTEDDPEILHVRLSIPPDPERDTRPERDEWTIYCSKEGQIFITVGDGPFSPQGAEELAAAVVKAAAKVRARTE